MTYVLTSDFLFFHTKCPFTQLVPRGFRWVSYINYSTASAQKMRSMWYRAEKRKFFISSDQSLPKFIGLVTVAVAEIKHGAQRM